MSFCVWYYNFHSARICKLLKGFAYLAHPSDWHSLSSHSDACSRLSRALSGSLCVFPIPLGRRIFTWKGVKLIRSKKSYLLRAQSLRARYIFLVAFALFQNQLLLMHLKRVKFDRASVVLALTEKILNAFLEFFRIRVSQPFCSFLWRHFRQIWKCITSRKTTLKLSRDVDQLLQLIICWLMD